MPELPEVETMRRNVLPIVGARVTDVEWPRSALRPIAVRPARPALRRRVRGQTVVDVERLGKRVALVLGSGDRVVLEPRMTGLVLLGRPPSAEHVRLRVHLAGGAAPGPLVFWDRRGLGTVRLLGARDAARAGLGPDALATSPGELCARLGASRRPIKVALLDQRAVAGVGNIYAAEALHAARLHPATPCRALDARAWAALHGALVDVLQASIRAGGSTLGDGTYLAAPDRPGAYRERHRVYGREGEPCASCRRARVERVVLAQRGTFFCPRCQPG